MKEEEPVPQRDRKSQGVNTEAETARKGTIKEHERTETQPRKIKATMRLWEGAWPEDAVISHFKLNHALDEEEHISARVALVPPDVRETRPRRTTRSDGLTI